MLTLTREQFEKEFGVSPGKLFDLRKILGTQHRIEAMGLPESGLMNVRREYGTMISDDKPNLIYALDVGYWISKGRFKAIINTVFIFDNQTEQDIHKAITASDESCNPQDN